VNICEQNSRRLELPTSDQPLAYIPTESSYCAILASHHKNKSIAPFYEFYNQYEALHHTSLSNCTYHLTHWSWYLTSYFYRVAPCDFWEIWRQEQGTNRARSRSAAQGSARWYRLAVHMLRLAPLIYANEVKKSGTSGTKDSSVPDVPSSTTTNRLKPGQKI